MRMKENRLKAKTAAHLSLTGFWLKGVILIGVLLILNMFCNNFIPLYPPEQPISVQALSDITFQQMLSLFMDALVPDVITRTFILRLAICISLFFLIIPPFQQGLKFFFFNVLTGKKPKLSVAFSWYLSLAKVFGAIRLYIYVGILSALWGLLCMILPASVIIAGQLFSSPALMLLGLLLYIAASILLSLKLTAYTPAFYIFSVTPSIGVVNAVKDSVRITRGRLWECFVFQLSFIPWNIAVMFTGNIGYLFFQPYFITSNMAFVNLLVLDANGVTSPPEEKVDAPSEE